MEPLSLLSVVIPARNEGHCISPTVRHLALELGLNHVPHEIVVVDDGSTDETWQILQQIQADVPTLKNVRNTGLHGFGRAVACGLDRAGGDAVVIMMADESDDCRDVVLYWKKLNEGYDCVFGSRFIKGAGAIDYPWTKYWLNRLGNTFIQLLFGLKYNDVTNAFKAYRATVLNASRPFISQHFNLTVELPLKAIVRGSSYAIMPISWRNRREGLAKFKIKEMGSRYLFTISYIWLESFLCKIDHRAKRKKQGREKVLERKQ